jgi:tetratricopeptide (TPR) repeat protein
MIKLIYTLALLTLGSTLFGTSFADQTLAVILKDQEKIFSTMKDNKGVENNLLALKSRFETFVNENPNNLEAQILYGKFLNRIEHYEEAFKVFATIDKNNPKIAVVKQQIANFLAETAKPDLALPYLAKAIELEPKQAIYHYQFGDLLCSYKDFYIESGIYTSEEWDAQMLESFKNAFELNPLEWTFAMRYGQAFYDLHSPQWEKALEHWNKLEKAAPPTDLDRETIYMHQAQVLAALGKNADAKKKLNKIFNPKLENNRRNLLQKI